MERKRKWLQEKMSYSFAATLITSGIFLKIGTTLLYVHKQTSPTDFEGLFLQDTRKGIKHIISGKKAHIYQNQQGIRITIHDGTYHRILPPPQKPPFTLTFQEYVLDIFPKEPQEKELPLQAISMHSLWTTIRHQKKQDSFPYAQEFHRRILLPLLPIGYAWWIPFVFFLRPFSHRSSFFPFFVGLCGTTIMQGAIVLSLLSMWTYGLIVTYSLLLLPGIFLFYRPYFIIQR